MTLVEGGVEIFASNQVIGEAFIAVQHHYGVSAEDAQTELGNVLRSGLVAALNGSAILETLATRGGPGLFDRLIANDYSRAGMETLTLDRSMASPCRHAASIGWLPLLGVDLGIVNAEVTQALLDVRGQLAGAADVEEGVFISDVLPQHIGVYSADAGRPTAPPGTG